MQNNIGSPTQSDRRKSLGMLNLRSLFWIGLSVALVLGGFGTYVYFVVPNGDKARSITSNKLDAELNDAAAVASVDASPIPSRKLRQAWFEPARRELKLVNRPEGLPEDSSYVTLAGEYEKWLLGTPVEVPIPQIKKRYRSIVDRIKPDQFGNTTIYAKPDRDEKELARLIITFNSTHTIAYVSTTVGSYELSGTATGGWLTPTSSLQQNRDFTIPDVVNRKRDRYANTPYVPPREK